MLHTCLIVHHDIRVMALQLLNLRLYDPIYKAVASLPLRSAHHHQIIVVFFRQGVGEPAFQIGCFGNTGGYFVSWIDTGPFNFFPELSNVTPVSTPSTSLRFAFASASTASTGFFPGFAEILDQQAAQRGLSHAAFSRYCDNMSHNVLLYILYVYKHSVDYFVKSIIIKLYRVSIVRFRKLYDS